MEWNQISFDDVEVGEEILLRNLWFSLKNPKRFCVYFVI